MSDNFELLTYKEFADRMNIKLASARQTVSRRRWKRVKGNDGSEVRVEVPVEYLSRREADTEGAAEIVSEIPTVDILGVKAENDYLKKRISDLEADRDAWKEQASKSFWKRLLG